MVQPTLKYEFHTLLRDLINIFLAPFKSLSISILQWEHWNLFLFFRLLCNYPQLPQVWDVYSSVTI